MNLKSAFLNGELKEVIYMVSSKVTKTRNTKIMFANSSKPYMA